ncbi:MAG TPA: phenylalanine--tRNA ligase subunit beta [Acidimicrobiales bacterium]|nr:phenylalanine--tRNA ligase subunit beta [Acidimicrobiales bacterium]
MLVPLSWLRDFAPFPTDDPVELGRTMDDLGMVVEGLRRIGEGLDGVVVARVLEVDAIPKADKIRRIVVDAGAPEAVQVVCGAWNFGVGDTVAFATVGAVLPGDFVIGERKMKGVASHGMICSSRELELGDDHDGIMVLPGELIPGTPLADALGIERDVVYDVAIEGNRPDANCIAGIARDLAARLNLPFNIPDPPTPLAASAAPTATVEVEAGDLSPRFSATVLTGLVVGPSPAWMARRLTLAGMRPINNVVDVSNYVMLELGQPTHAYDMDKLAGPGLRVRRGRDGEKVVTLDGVARMVGPDDCLICDADNRAVGIAGIMGGASSETDPDTTSVLLEAAFFDRMAIARSSQRLKLRSEASARFDKGCDPAGIDRAVARIVELLPGTTAGAMIDVVSTNHLPRPPRVVVRPARVNAVLGVSLSAIEMSGYLAPLGFAVSPAGDVLDVEPPTYRPDIEREADVVEEIARHHGYSRIERTVPRSPFVGHLTAEQRERRRLRSLLIGLGITEAQSPSLVGPGDHEKAGIAPPFITAADPLVREESVLRASLLPGLIRSIAFNAAHRAPGARLFEIGHTFRPLRSIDWLVDEHEVLAVALAGADAVEAVAVARALAAHLRVARLDLHPDAPGGLHPTRTAAILLSGVAAGWVGEVDPGVLEVHGITDRVAYVELDTATLSAAPRRADQQRPISRFPSSDIDLAFAVGEGTPASAVEDTLRVAAGDLLSDLRLFDVYRGAGMADGTRSLAYRLRFNAFDRTLTDDDVATARQRCIDAVEANHPAALRG